MNLFCFSSCSNTQEGEHVILSFNEEFVSYSTFTDNGIIVREKMNWTSTDNCISSSKTESLKLDKDILYTKQEIEKQEVWYPYLLLSSNKGVSYTELLPFVSFPCPWFMKDACSLRKILFIIVLRIVFNTKHLLCIDVKYIIIKYYISFNV